jgi:AraC family transcriptional regulator
VKLIEEFASSAPADRLAARAGLLRLLSDTLRLVEALPASRRAGETRPLTTDRRIEAALSHLEARLSQQITVKDMARAAHLSPEHFSVLFRRATGQTPMAYVRARRIQVARELLGSESSSIAEVAKNVGFGDPFHFSRVFNRLVGASPSGYRSALRSPFSP